MYPVMLISLYTQMEGVLVSHLVLHALNFKLDYMYGSTVIIIATMQKTATAMLHDNVHAAMLSHAEHIVYACPCIAALLSI